MTFHPRYFIIRKKKSDDLEVSVLVTDRESFRRYYKQLTDWSTYFLQIYTLLVVCKLLIKTLIFITKVKTSESLSLKRGVLS